ncbi:MAG: hypothetical protein N838_29825 [Thiohalocapsa sp. PB-PSB1]|nr:MAG: hypothetical protein N838_29825 [Thiohalocapsa sp. PB-PSB1]
MPAQACRGPLAFRLFITIGWLAVIGTAFAGGYFLAGYDSERAMVRIQALQAERDSLKKALIAEREARHYAERSGLIDHEVKRAAQMQLVGLQTERLRLAKQVSYLKGLVRNGGAGVVEVKEFVLAQGDNSDVFDYQIFIGQLIPDFGLSKGIVVVKLAVRRGDSSEILELSELPGSSSGRHIISFHHFQSLSGTIRVPQNIEPLYVIVDIEPDSDNLIRSSESFAWVTDSNTYDLGLTQVPGNETATLKRE